MGVQHMLFGNGDLMNDNDMEVFFFSDLNCTGQTHTLYHRQYVLGKESKDKLQS